MQLSAEQQTIIATNSNLIINAVAGSGKTTTLIEYAKSRPANCKILYLAFNKTVKTEAQQKFAAAGLSNVKVETAHSLAYSHIVHRGNQQVVQGYKSYDLAEILGINTGDRHTDFLLAGHVNKFMSYFCNSSAPKVQSLNYADVVSDAKALTFVENFYEQIEKFTRQALAHMNKGTIAVTHDFYLKKFQLSAPVLDYHYILFDEGQDASAAMLDVFLNQQAIKIIVGDAHQQIYGWRYAINSLQQVNFPTYQLSNSFRFNDEIALIANKILGWKKALNISKPVRITGVKESENPVFTRATLGRTNLGLMLHAVAMVESGQIDKLFFEGHINSYTFADEGASLYDVLNLYLGKKERIKDKIIASMPTMKDLQDYAEKSEDNSLLMIIEVVKKFGQRLPSLISELKSRHTATKEEADMIFSTVHRCKGMEYDEVELLDDFLSEQKLKDAVSEAGSQMPELIKNRLAEEVNILYVAATRAKEKLKIPAELNPLTSIEMPIAMPQYAPQTIIKFRNSYDFDAQSAYSKSFGSKPGNSGKKWTTEDEDEAEQMYLAGKPIKEIAKKLGRGQKGVEYKLKEMGLMDDDDDYFNERLLWETEFDF